MQDIFELINEAEEEFKHYIIACEIQSRLNYNTPLVIRKRMLENFLKRNNLVDKVISASKFSMGTIINVICRILSTVEGADYMPCIRETEYGKEIEFIPGYISKDSKPLLVLYANEFGKISFYGYVLKRFGLKDLIYGYNTVDYGYIKDFIDMVINARLKEELLLNATDTDEFLAPIADQYISKLAQGKIDDKGNNYSV